MLSLKLKLKLPLSWRVTTKLFSSDIGIDSEAESPPLSPVAEHPRLEESWVDSHREPSSEVESYRTETDSDSAAEEVVKLAAERVAEKLISQYLSAGCGCDDYNQYSGNLTNGSLVHHCDEEYYRTMVTSLALF